jgi:hypothetical protein
MTNHPNRSRTPYTAEIGGSSWAQGPTARFATIRECREFAESYGDAADWCTITDSKGREVARHVRDRAGRGWYRAAV